MSPRTKLPSKSPSIPYPLLLPRTPICLLCHQRRRRSPPKRVELHHHHHHHHCHKITHPYHPSPSVRMPPVNGVSPNCHVFMDMDKWRNLSIRIIIGYPDNSLSSMPITLVSHGCHPLPTTTTTTTNHSHKYFLDDHLQNWY